VFSSPAFSVFRVFGRSTFLALFRVCLVVIRLTCQLPLLVNLGLVALVAG